VRIQLAQATGRWWLVIWAQVVGCVEKGLATCFELQPGLERGLPGIVFRWPRPITARNGSQALSPGAPEHGQNVCRGGLLGRWCVRAALLELAYLGLEHVLAVLLVGVRRTIQVQVLGIDVTLVDQAVLLGG
jgi:hypothetical protein